MKTSLAAAIIIIVILILGAAGIYWAYQKPSFSTPSIFKFTQKPSLSPTPQAKFSTPPTPPPQTQPATGSDTLGISLGIFVEDPAKGSFISSPIIVRGRANVLSGELKIIIKDANNQILGQGTATACLDSSPCPFEASIVFEKSKTTTGTIEISSGQFLQIISVNLR